MNKENLLKMAAHIRTVPQEMFDMIDFRESGAFESAECKSIGCVIGHCTVLDAENVKENFTAENGIINFPKWSTFFTGMRQIHGSWEWCFDEFWKPTDNTPEGAAKRIEWLVNKGLPENWLEQMHGDAELCYL